MNEKDCGLENEIFGPKINKQNIESIIYVICDIKECLLSDRPADAFLNRWSQNNPEVPEAEKDVRTVYARELEKAEAILKTFL